jgi:hypothetical protein
LLARDQQMAANQRLRHVGKAGRGCFSHAANMAPRGRSVQRDVGLREP